MFIILKKRKQAFEDPQQKSWKNTWILSFFAASTLMTSWDDLFFRAGFKVSEA